MIMGTITAIITTIMTTVTIMIMGRRRSERA